jgi:hypothetical protein
VAGTTPLPNKRDANIRNMIKADGTFEKVGPPFHHFHDDPIGALLMFC